MDSVQERVKKVLLTKHLSGVGTDEISLDTPLIGFGIGVDSVSTLELIVSLEEEFRVAIDEEGIVVEDLATIESLSELLKKNMERGA